MSVWGGTFHDLDSPTRSVDMSEASHEPAASAVEVAAKDLGPGSYDHFPLVSNLAIRQVRRVELSTLKRGN